MSLKSILYTNILVCLQANRKQMSQIIPIINLSEIEHSSRMDFLNDDLVIFDDLNEIPLHDYPNRVDAAVFAICLKGFIRFSVNLKEYTITPRNMVVLLPEQIVQQHERSDDFEGIFIGVSKQFIDDIIPGVQNLLAAFFYVKEHPFTVLTDDEQNDLIEYHSVLWKKIRMKEHVFHKEVVQSLLLALFYDVCNIFRKHQSHDVRKRSRKEELFELFMRTVMDHYRQERSVGFYADKLCVTAKYLSLASKEVSGKSAGNWIDEYVILEAKALLKSSNMTIQEIADTLNFANQSFFGKYFKHHTGVSPKEYRKV